jgi:hypothetical protein
MFSSIMFSNRSQRVMDLVLDSKLNMQSGLLEVESEFEVEYAIRIT